MSQPAGQYFIRLGTQLLGPLTLEQLRNLKERGRLQPFHSVSVDGKTWQPASSLSDLFPPQPASSAQAFDQSAKASETSAQAPQEYWFYLDPNHNQVGPVSQTSLLELLRSNNIAPDTYIWKQGMDSWKKLEEVFPEVGIKRRSREKPLGWLTSARVWITVAIMVLLVLIVLVAIWIIGPVRQYNAQELFDTHFMAVPLLLKPPVSGSGFIIKVQTKKGERWFVVTNNHVIEALQEAIGENPRERRLPFTPKWDVLIFSKSDGRTISLLPKDSLLVRYMHPKADVALVECTDASDRLVSFGVKPLELAPRNYGLKPGTEVVAIGHPGLGGKGEIVPMTYTKGQIAGPEREIEGIRYHQLQVPLTHGNSGGPVLDMTGQVVGIVTMGAARNNQGQFNFALHLKYLYELLDEIP